ncbi:hypothetical protein BHE74_00052214 [Ensete ventricosum]|nr:hypothetical protein BHE74_00052214 [Ensete ventricosum]
MWKQRHQRCPKTWPVIGSTIEQLKNYDRMHDWLAGYLSESKTVTVSLPFKSYTYIADPASVEHVLKTKFTNYPKVISVFGPKPYSRCNLSHVDVQVLEGGSRKTASLEFASKNLRDFSTRVFREHALKLSRILCQVPVDRDLQLLWAQDLFMRMTLDSISKIGFGVEIGTLAADLPENAFAQAFDDANIIVTNRFIDPFWRIKRLLRVQGEGRLQRSIKVLDEFTYDIIRTRKAKIKLARANERNGDKMKHDLLSRFIELGEGDGSIFSDDKSLRDVVLNFVIAGRDTTAATLSWFVYMVMTHPGVAEKLHDELKAFEEERAKEEEGVARLVEAFDDRLTQFAGFLSYDSMGRLAYLHACILETLRLYPAVPQDPKGILEDDVLPDGTKVKAGDMVVYVPYVMGRMEYNWGPDAALYKPERWFKDGVLQTVSPFKFTAFQVHPP